MNTIHINEIIIPEKFVNHPPNNRKIQLAMEYYNKHNELDKPIIIDNIQNKVLINNYVRYLVAKEKGLEEIPYMTVEEYKEPHLEVSYICGVFSNNSKEYIWKNLWDFDFNIGDKALVKSQKRKAVVTVTKVFKSNDPSYLKHKKVFKKLERKERTDETGS